MRISTRARYGVRFLVDLAGRQEGGPVYLKDIARSQEISEKYLSQIVIELKSAGIISGFRGAHGGYVLARDPAEITLKEIVSVLEGDLSVIDCVQNSKSCGRMDKCVSREVWMRLGEVIAETLEAITLADLVRRMREKTGEQKKQFRFSPFSV
jgi:Rrf2 family protein